MITLNRFNYHTHSDYCDGKSTLRENVLSALSLEMDEIGFSSHAPLTLPGEDTSFCTPENKIGLYKAEVRALAKEYADKIKIKCGIETDYFSNPCEGYDFIIGSVHYVFKDGYYCPVDLDKETLKRCIDKHWGGSADSFACDYFALVKQIYKKTSCDIIGHFDLLTKFDEEKPIFNQKSPAYLEAARDAVIALAKDGALFEINTGAMSRCGRSVPFPSPDIMRFIKEAGGLVTFGSDAHHAEDLLFRFEDMERYARSFGFERFEML